MWERHYKKIKKFNLPGWTVHGEWVTLEVAHKRWKDGLQAEYQQCSGDKHIKGERQSSSELGRSKQEDEEVLELTPALSEAIIGRGSKRRWDRGEIF